mgnify:CR=1 FL=1
MQKQSLMKMNMRFYRAALIATILCLATCLSAQEPLFVITKDSLQSGRSLLISERWKYHPGDNIAWADPNFDDSDWEIVDSHLTEEAMPESGWPGIGWFRSYLEVDSALAIVPMAIFLSHNGASEIYINGELKYRFGKVGASTEDEVPFAISVEQPQGAKSILLRGGETYLFAVRYSNFVLYEKDIASEVGFTLVLTNIDEALARIFTYVRFTSSGQSIMVAIPFVFSISHFLLFFFYRRQREHIYFAIFTASLSAMAFFAHENVFGFETDTRLGVTYVHITYTLFIFLGISGVRFLYSLFYRKPPKWYFVILAVAAIQCILVWVVPLSIPAQLAILFFVIMVLEMFRIVILAILRKKEDAWLIGSGFIAFAAGSLIIVLFITNILPDSAIYPLIFWFAAILVVPLTMSAFLARRFAAVNLNLQSEIKKSAELEIQNARQEMELQKAKELKEAYQALEQAHVDLKATQQQLITQEKLASLGQLTAGIAHEIKNPLNFVNNFAALSVDLAKELREEIAKIEDGGLKIEDSESLTSIKEILATLEQNAEKINHHGKRADGIVKSMMQHARGSSGQREPADLNHLLDEAVNLVYHGMRANDPSFSITIEKEYDESIDKLDVVPQDLSRVFLNMVNNACYAAFQKQKAKSKEQKANGDNFSPTIAVATKNLRDGIEIRIRDNGNGIPPDIREKIFDPFFTTKPTGQGTGLGLSISHDVIVQQHRGEIQMETEEGEFSEFVVRLPRACLLTSNIDYLNSRLIEFDNQTRQSWFVRPRLTLASTAVKPRPRCG